MGVIDFSTALNNSISAGSAVEGNVVRIIADNGAEIGEGVFKVIEGGNGTAAEVGVATQTGASGAVATGMAYLTMEVSSAAVALAPALGIAAGVGLYNATPEFWDMIAEYWVNAGKTIGGKVLAYWNGENIYFDEDTIEVYKNALLAYGAFEVSQTADIPEGESISIEPVQTPLALTNQYLIYGLEAGSYAIRKAANSKVAMIRHRFQDNIFFDGLFASANSGVIGYDGSPNNINTPVNSEVSYTYDNKTVYWALRATTYNANNIENTVGSDNTCEYNVNAGLPASILRNVAWIMIYGDITSSSTFPLQEDAIYPSDEEFPLTYPDWLPHEFPSTLPDPGELPDIYPVKYPGVGPDGYPSQDPAQNPDPESVPEIYPKIIPDFNVPDPGLPEPEPEPEPDPDPQPEPDPIPESKSEPGEDPVDPNIPPDPSVPIIVPPLPTTASSNKLFTVYNPSSSQLDSLGGYLWDASLIATLRDIWQDPLDGIISLQQVFVTPTTSGNQNIMLGYLDTQISSPVVSSQFVTVDCGSVSVPENKKNATDYAPYTSLHLYLPFIGIVELDVNECMNGTISVKYQVDVYTGTCLAQVSIDRDADMPNDPILYTFSGNCSQQLPLTSGNATGLLTALIGAVGAGIKASSGGALSALAGAQLLGNSISHEMMHVSHSGNISANAGIMGQKKPYLIIGRRHCYDANNYNAYYGFPANKTLVIGNYTGFIRAKKCWIKTTALQEEYEEIMRLLEDGVFV